MISKIKEKQFFIPRILFMLVTIFMVFDGIRSNLLFGGVLSIIRDLSLILLFAYSFIIKKKRIVFSRKLMLWPFFVYHVFVCLMTFLQPGYIQLSFMVKPFFILIGIFLFYHYESLTGKSYSYLFTKIVQIIFVFVICDILFYFIRIPIFKPDIGWWGRISCGYPTMDVITLSYGLILLMFYNKLQINVFWRVVYLIVVFVGFVVQFTGTGIVLLTIIISASLYFFAKTKYKKLYKFYIYFFVILFLFSGSSISYISKKYPQEYRSGLYLMQNKIDILLGNEVETNTMEVRQEQFSSKLRGMLPLERVIGRSLINVTNDGEVLSINRKTYMIEDQYSLCQICYGLIGLFLFILMVISVFFYFYSISIDFNSKVLLCLSIIVFIVNSKTLISLVLFPNIMFFALFMGYGLKLSDFCKKRT